MKKIDDILSFVEKNNKFYKNIINDLGIKNPLDIKQYPILSRECLQRNRYNMFSSGYKNKYYWQQLLRKSSSGSTGIPINVYWDYTDYYITMKEVWHRRKKYYDILPCDKQVAFSIIKNDDMKKECNINYINEPINILNISVDEIFDSSLHERLIELINLFEPTWLYVRPFVLQKLLAIFKDNDKNIATLKYIETYGELLPEKLKNDASKYFEVPVVNMYGSEEITTIAYECPCHKMHILQNNVFAECFRDNSFYEEGEGELIVTSLTNKAMPLIRYNQGDIIKIKKLSTPCGCGSQEAVVEKISGRKIEILNIGNNVELTPLIFMDIMASIHNMFDSMIKYYKFVYSKSSRKVMCYIALQTDYQSWYKNIEEWIRKGFQNRINMSEKLVLEIINVPYSNVVDKKFKIFEIVE